MNPRDLALEITESVLMEKHSGAVDIPQALKDLGVRLVMDDFGTGYSSITNLKSFPVDCLKIDRSMVGRVDEVSENQVVVSATRVLAQGLGLEVVAEGVETTGELAKLRSLGSGLRYCTRLLLAEAVLHRGDGAAAYGRSYPVAGSGRS
jgi:EAL domain-containing protein (putative c-di-GMP-specific phosphodiesterase class I)